jgi:hypothetical protein
MVKTPPNKTSAPVDSSEVPKDGLPYTSMYDLSETHQKAEALLPILAIACLRLNSSSIADLHVMHILFARVHFFNRAKLLPFPIHRKNCIADLTPQAKSYLHGKYLQDLLSPSQEAFVRFVTLLDLMRYHHNSLKALVIKYGALFTDEDTDALLHFMNDYQGSKNKNSNFAHSNGKSVFKGYRSHDIALFLKMKKQVLEDHQHAVTILAELDEAAKKSIVVDGFPTNCFKVCPFILHYPDQEVEVNIKVEPDDSTSRKRKLSASIVATNTNVCHQAMELDDDDLFDYGPATTIGI